MVHAPSGDEGGQVTLPTPSEARELALVSKVYRLTLATRALRRQPADEQAELLLHASNAARDLADWYGWISAGGEA